MMTAISALSRQKRSSLRIEERLLLTILSILGCCMSLSWINWNGGVTDVERTNLVESTTNNNPPNLKSNSVIIGSSLTAPTSRLSSPNPFSPPSVIPYPLAAHAGELAPPQNVPHYRESWNGFLTEEQNIFYTYQDFYTDAQYGADFGYYSKGRILQGEYFNSYTTYPMGNLSCMDMNQDHTIDVSDEFKLKSDE
jgi:hypothetical protein